MLFPQHQSKWFQVEICFGLPPMGMTTCFYVLWLYLQVGNTVLNPDAFSKPAAHIAVGKLDVYFRGLTDMLQTRRITFALIRALDFSMNIHICYHVTADAFSMTPKAKGQMTFSMGFKKQIMCNVNVDNFATI